MTWHHRDSITLSNGLLQAAVLPGGGILAEFRFADTQGPTQHNALWESPWTTHTPGDLSTEQLQQTYGDIGTGRFLDAFTGHALCLNGFGPATEQDVLAGGSLHGEASTVLWNFDITGPAAAHGSATLPLAGLRVTRSFSMLPSERVLRVDERVTNLTPSPRAVQWVQHATIGPPMFSDSARVAVSADRGVTWPFPYDGSSLLDRDACFQWPYAPKENGGSLDLRQLFSATGHGFVAAVRQVPGRPFGFVAALDPMHHVALVYTFSAEHFPWVALWEENRARKDSPWNGRVQCRGLEFGTTPLPLGAPRAALHILETPTACDINAHATVRAPWLVALIETPTSWTQIDDVLVEENALVLHHGSATVRAEALCAAEFLRAKGEV